MKKKRFIQSIVTTAKSETVAMPWERGARRASFALKRQMGTDLRASA